MSGKTVTGATNTNNQKYNGNHKAMDDDFKTEVSQTIEYILAPKNLVPKAFNGLTVTGLEFPEILAILFEVFDDEKLPNVEAVFDAIAEKQMTMIITSYLDSYKQSIYKNRHLLKNKENWKNIHEANKNLTLQMFSNSRRFVSSINQIEFRKLMEKEIDCYGENLKQKLNEKRKDFEEEMDKIHQDLEEKQKFKFEQFESEIKVKEMFLSIKNGLSAEEQELVSQINGDTHEGESKVDEELTLINYDEFLSKPKNQKNLEDKENDTVKIEEARKQYEVNKSEKQNNEELITNIEKIKRLFTRI